MRKFNPDKELKKIQKGSKNKILYGTILLLLIISIGSTYALYQVRYSKRIIYTKVGDFSRDINILAVFIDDDKVDDFPKKEDEVVYDRILCDNNEDNHVSAYWDYDAWGLVVEASKKAKCNVYFKSIKANDVIDFAYNGIDGTDGTIQTFIVPLAGRYKLEVWGAQGGAAIATSFEAGGLGGYSVGEVTLTKGQKLYIGVGGQGETATLFGTETIIKIDKGGFNGGGNGVSVSQLGSSGGGATHIATIPGILSTLELKKDNLLIVAGGGGAGWRGSYGGSGGGIQGNDGVNTVGSGKGFIGVGATQTVGGWDYNHVNEKTAIGLFGQGGNGYVYEAPDAGGCQYNQCGGNGGGGGFFGGGGSSREHAGGGGGSGYIGNSLLSNKAMYCYQCTPSEVNDTKTISTVNHSEEPISMYAKQGNGAARITYLGAN